MNSAKTLAAQKEFALVRNQYLSIDPRCEYCWGTDLWLPNGKIELCPELSNPKKSHPISSIEANIVAREATRVQNIYKSIDENLFDIARYLTRFSEKTPCKRKYLDRLLYGRVNWETTRLVTKFIERLRVVWMLPVGSRRSKPSGFWIITDAREYARWFDHALAASRTQFRNFYWNAKHNYPLFAAQLSLNFFENLEGEYENRE
jgi:hypothetical protein